LAIKNLLTQILKLIVNNGGWLWFGVLIGVGGLLLMLVFSTNEFSGHCKNL